MTLDLNGFALVGVASSVDGLAISGSRTNVTFRNGAISGWGNDGVNGGSACNLSCEQLDVSAVNWYGIYCVGSAVIRNCQVWNAVYGIHVTGSAIINCTVASCINGGIYAGASIVAGCLVQSNNFGIAVDSSTVTGCSVSGNSSTGIYVSSAGSQIVGNNCLGNNTGNGTSAGGIAVYGPNNRIENNLVTASGFAGILVNYAYTVYTNNVIIKNMVGGNGAKNYVLSGSQFAGSVITNNVAGVITNTSPWANFSY